MAYEQWSNPNVSAAKNLFYQITDNPNLPIPNFNFTLIVEASMPIPCKSVSSIVRENEFDFIQEGGVNDYVLMRRKAITKPFEFTVERYSLSFSLGYDPLQEGADLVLPLILMVTPAVGNMMVTRRAYVFTGCTVKTKEYGELNAEQSGLLTERTTIAYRELMVVSVPPQIAENNVKEWLFPKADGGNDRRPTDYQGENGSRRENKESTKAIKDYKTGQINPDKWNITHPDKNRRTAEGDALSSYSIEDYVPGKRNPEMWNINNPDQKSKTKGKDEASTKSTLYGPWQFDGKNPMGKMQKRPDTEAKPDADGNYPLIDKDIRAMARYDESTRAIENYQPGQKNPNMWSMEDPQKNRRMTEADELSSAAIEDYEAGQKNPNMWSMKTPNSNRRTDKKDVDSTRAKVNGPWQFNGTDPAGMLQNRPDPNAEPGADGSKPEVPTDVRTMASRDVMSTRAIEGYQPGQKNPNMWNIVSPAANRRTADGDSVSTDAIPDYESGQVNPEMWRFDEKKEKGNAKQNARDDISKDVPQEGKRLWKFDKDRKNFKGQGTQSARSSFDK